MFDFIGFAETHSTLATVAVVLGLIVLYLAGREARDIYRGAVTTRASVLLQEQAIRDDEAAVVYRKDVLELVMRMYEIVEDLQTKAETHYSDVQRLADDEHWKNCPVDKCPNLPTVLANLKQSNSTLTELVTNFRQLTIEIIATLRSSRNGETRRGEGNA